MTIKELATKYRASFEATARRLVERSFQACMLVVFQQEPTRARIDVSQTPVWSVKYCVASPSFRSRYFTKFEGTLAPEVVAVVTQPGRDIADSLMGDVSLTVPTEEAELPFQGEFFYNQWNIFCLLIPKSPPA